MELCFSRRNRALKTLLSLALLSATLITLHRFHLELIRTQEPHRGVPTTPRACPPPSWDVEAPDCSEDPSVRHHDWFRRLDGSFQQYVLRRRCRYFPLLLNHPEKCRPHPDRGAADLLLLVVKSVIEQHDRREAVRRTWGREQVMDGVEIRTLFLLGTPATGKDDRNLQKLVLLEDRVYGDILQWDFMDTFFNLTLKEVNFLKWFDVYCPRVRFVFKGDDDVFVHTGNLVDLLNFKTKEHKDSGLFVGDSISKAFPIRNQQSKYFIPKELFDKPYPPYTGGGGFLMSADITRRLFVVSEELELFPIDDVFLGMCLQRLHMAPEPHPAFRTFGIKKRKVSPMNSDPCFFRDLIVVHKLNPQELVRMWDLVFNENLMCAKKVVF